ncbi:flavoprotein [Tepiditoga spiralis]|uniref:Flavoprotein n=1 Tax=Tepiditoga spiralis TaxID=2108365 RepID=A0A7G1G2K7_9BACT|nr:NAD(P)/FAD-dependent oxidoreductase [Tepiditoga spiralis]BBE30600.1 flavoprotein [Tepiditoga spiralis]
MIVVIGGGASGLMAAISAAKLGAKVTILEKMNKPGKKILASGNGKCNYTNINTNINNYHGKDKKFIESIINNFNVNSTIEFFKQIGVYPKIDSEGRVYPFSLQASSVVDNLLYECKKHNVNIVCNAKVTNIKKKNNLYEVYYNDTKIKANSLIVSVGGKSSSKLGSDGSLFNTIKSLNHNFSPMYPAIVQLKLKGNFKEVKGVRVRGEVTLYDEKKLIAKEKGEQLFTDYGISGISVMNLSGYVHSLKKPILKLDFFPNFSLNELISLLLSRKKNMPHKTFKESFIGLLNSKLIHLIFKLSNIKDKKYSNVSIDEIKKISKILKESTFDIVGTKDFENSQVTAGGLLTSEINSKTLESKINKNLYFCGEVLDVYGDCGGYNLQWAWSSGYIAGKSAGGKYAKNK